MQEKHVTYNPFHEQLITAKLETDTKVYGENKIILDDQKRIGNISSCDGTKYNISYDPFGKQVAFKREGETLPMLSKEYLIKDNIVVTNYHRSDSEVDKITMCYDKY